MSTFGKAVLRLLPQELNQRRAARSIDRPARRQSRPTVPVTGPPTGCRRPAVHAGLDPYPSGGDPGEDLLGGGGGRGGRAAPPRQTVGGGSPVLRRASWGSSGSAVAGGWQQAYRPHPDLQQGTLHELQISRLRAGHCRDQPRFSISSAMALCSVVTSHCDASMQSMQNKGNEPSIPESAQREPSMI